MKHICVHLRVDCAHQFVAKNLKDMAICSSNRVLDEVRYRVVLLQDHHCQERVKLVLRKDFIIRKHANYLRNGELFRCLHGYDKS